MKTTLSVFLISTFLFLSACEGGGSTPSPANAWIDTPTTGIDPILAPYKERFEQIAKDNFGQTYNTSNLTMRFGSMDDDQTIAICNLYYINEYSEANITRREIVVNPDYWDTGDVVKDNFMTHELGHCLNFRGHDTSEVSFPSEGKNGPTSIMYPNPIAMLFGYGPDFYLRNLEYYLTEIFTINKYGTIFESGGSNSVEGLTIKKSFSIKTTGCEEKASVAQDLTE